MEDTFAINSSLIITWLVTAVSLVIISRLNVGIGIDSFVKALVAAIVIGLVNALLGPVAQAIVGAASLPMTLLVALIINALLFWIAAYLVPGFTLQRGFWSALLGAVLLTVINALLMWLLGALGIA